MKNSSFRSQFLTTSSSSATHDAPPAAPAAAAALTSVAQMAINVDSLESKLWPDFVTKAFIDIMVDEVTKGNMPNGVFHARTWNSMTTRLNSITNRSFKMDQLKAKMHRLRAMYREFYSLLQNTGFGWNAETNTVTASEEVWRNYLQNKYLNGRLMCFYGWFCGCSGGKYGAKMHPGMHFLLKNLHAAHRE
uniref:L10-interacting MYB domain-containing protein-like n=2 Tax=Cicer arietinum TaxID=3827 RepID=A0A1S2Z176_CICAR